MRILVLALAILLLPLRSWLGDAMAVQMLPQGPAQAMHAMHTVQDIPGTRVAAAMADHADHADHADPSAHAGHTMHAGHAAPVDSATSTGSHGDCPGPACGNCQLCHSVAMGLLLPVLPTAQPHGAAPALDGARFSSAEPAPGFKPPIS